MVVLKVKKGNKVIPISIPDKVYKETIVYVIMNKKLNPKEIKRIAKILKDNNIIDDTTFRKTMNVKTNKTLSEIFGNNTEVINFLVDNGKAIFYGRHAHLLNRGVSEVALFSAKKWKDGVKFNILGLKIALSKKDLDNIDKTAAGIGSGIGAVVGTIIPGAGTGLGATIGGSIGAGLGTVMKSIGTAKAKKVVEGIKKGKTLKQSMDDAGLSQQEQSLLLNAFKNMTSDSIVTDIQHQNTNNQNQISKYMPYIAGGIGALALIMLMRR